MENAEEIMNVLEVFTNRKSKTIPPELNDYLAYVARTGDPVFQWGLVKSLFKEKLLCILTEFYENSPGNDIPSYPNVDPFNYESMKNSLLERLDTFLSAPFTLQRICELLINPRKEYNRIDKYMRAIEKNIMVVSTREPGAQSIEQENGGPVDPVHNGSDSNSDCNIDVEMEEVSSKESRLSKHKAQPSSSNYEKHNEVDNDEKSKSPVHGIDHQVAEYESVTPPDSVHDENEIQESDSTEDDKAEDSSNSSDEVIPKPPDTDSKDKEGKPFDIPEIVISMELIDQKESNVEISESNCEAGEPKEEIADNEATPVTNDNLKTEVTAIETDDASPSNDTISTENINDVIPEKDISQDDDKINNKSSEVNKIFDEAIVVEKNDVQAESVSEPLVNIQDNAEIEAAVNVIDIVPEESNATECTVKDNKESPKSPSLHSTADSLTEVESTDTNIEADAKDEKDLANIDQDLAETAKEVADDKSALPDGKIIEDTDQIADKPAEPVELTPDSST